VSRTSTGSSSRSSPERLALRTTLGVAGVRPAKELGQSFLIDPFVADAEAALADPGPGRPVLEIGPGTGVLTEALLRRGVGPLTVLELDRRLAAHLRTRFADRITVLEGDARFAPLPPADVVVGNLPFSSATPILLRLLRGRVPKVVALVQAEVAERLLATSGGRASGRLTLVASLFAEAEGFLPVPPEAFEPIPAVSGRVVAFTARPDPLAVPDLAAFEQLTRVLFAGRRKQLKNLLPKVLPPGWAAADAAAAAEWPEDWATRRPEELAPPAYFALARVLQPARPDPRTTGQGNLRGQSAETFR
jgi:16S rRNA (adenine1518-N6/adenine1519-N6)-dimethyltransferase